MDVGWFVPNDAMLALIIRPEFSRYVESDYHDLTREPKWRL